MQQLVLDYGVRTLAVLDDLLQIAAQCVRQFRDFSARPVVDLRGRQGFLQLIDQLDRESREVVDEIERILDLVRDTGGQLAERGEFLGLNKAVLRGPQILQRLRKFPRSRFHALEQAY